MSNIEKIRQEIERRIGSVNEEQDANPAMPKYRWHMYEGMKEAFLDMKYFIDSLPEEPVCEELNEEWKRYMDSCRDDVSGQAVTVNIKNIARHFAEWQKEQMLKDAVEGEVVQDLHGKLHVKTNAISDILYHFGDKVKVLIIPEKCQNS